MPDERRRSPRIPFAASAEIIDEAENTRSASQVCDLSLHGGFVRVSNPFRDGSAVTIEIYKDEDFVETPATVAYFQPKRGMGLTFTGTEPQFASVLKKWVANFNAATGYALRRIRRRARLFSAIRPGGGYRVCTPRRPARVPGQYSSA